MDPPRTANDAPDAPGGADPLLDRFEEAWQNDAPPRLEDFWSPSSSGSGAPSANLLKELVKIDLDYRWRRAADRTLCGDDTDAVGPKVEDYLRRFPELAAAPAAVLELAGEEYRVRTCWGDRPGRAEYHSRFAGHRTRLDAALARVEEEVAAEFGKEPTPSRPLPAPTPKEAGAPPSSPVALASLLQQLGLLDEKRRKELAAALRGKPLDARGLARELLQRDWLTPYQVNQLLPGRGADLAVGQYLVLERLGEGGTGQVFKARHRSMDRVVALKVIRPELLADAEVVGRFYREIHIVGRLSHPHVVHAFDAGPMGDRHVLVMEFVNGTDLYRLVERDGPLPAATACDYVRQAALGLQHAHEQGLVHRDVKPSNLLVTHAHGKPSVGVVKLLDLGLARLQGKTPGHVTGNFTPVNAVMMGTPDYMAPEQAVDFHGADIRADIYSLGCTLFYLVTGRPPFAGGTLAEKLLKHQQAEPPPVETLRPDVPPGLSAVLKRLLAKRPEDRYQTPAEVADATGPLPPAVVAPPAPRRASRRRAVLALVVLLLLAGVGAYFGLSHPRPPAKETETRSPAQAELQDLLARGGEGRRGELVAFALRHPGTPEAEEALQRAQALPSPLDGLDRDKIPPDERFDWQPPEVVAVLGEHRGRPWGAVRGASFSPDGHRLATAGKDGLLRVWDLKAAPWKVSAMKAPAGWGCAAHDPKGRCLAAGGEDGTVALLDPDTGKPRAAAKPHAGAVRGVAFSPDGARLASGGEDGTVRVWAVDAFLQGAAAEQSVFRRSPAAHINAVAFSPDGKMLAAAGDDSRVVLYPDVANPAEKTDLPRHAGTVQALAFARKDRHLLLLSAAVVPAKEKSDAGGEVRAWDVDERRQLPPAVGLGPYVYSLAVTPDGRTVAVGTQDGLRLLDVADGKDRAVPGNYQAVRALGFSPDGKHLAVGLDSGSLSLVEVATGKRLGTTDPPRGEALALALSPDGRTLLKTAGPARPGELEFWELPACHARGVSSPGEAVTAVAFAPDGRTAATGDQAGAVRLWDVEARKPTRTFGGLTRPVHGLAFSPDGKLLAAGEGGKGARVRLWELATGNEWTPSPEGLSGAPAFAFAPDGRTLALASYETSPREFAARLWDLAARAERGAVPFAPRPATAVAYSPDGSRLAIAAPSGVKLWDVAGAKPLPPLAQSSAIRSLAFLGGRRVLAATADGKVVLWDGGGDVSKQWQLRGSLKGAVLAADGRHLVTLNANGTAYVLRLPADPPPRR